MATYIPWSTMLACIVRRRQDMHHIGQVFIKEHAARVLLLVMPPSTMGTASVTAQLHRHSSCRVTVATGSQVLLHPASSEQTPCTSERFNLEKARLRHSQSNVSPSWTCLQFSRTRRLDLRYSNQKAKFHPYANVHSRLHVKVQYKKLSSWLFPTDIVRKQSPRLFT
jgi:hypothetical protein